MTTYLDEKRAGTLPMLRRMIFILNPKSYKLKLLGISVV